MNWDVEELLEKRTEIEESDVCTLGLMGWPFEKKIERQGEQGY